MSRSPEIWELLTPGGVLYVIQLLWSDPEGVDLSEELEPLLNAFEEIVRSVKEYNDIVQGPRAELQRWFSQHRRTRDDWRVSKEGLLQALQWVQKYVADNDGELPTDDRKGEAILDGF